MFKFTYSVELVRKMNSIHTSLMWNSPLYVGNMFYYYWNIKESALAYGRQEYSQTGKRYIERTGRVKGTPCSR